MKLSIIVPCYNVEPYIEACVESIVKNSIKDYEIILINDGSSDHTSSVLEKIKKQYKEVIVIEQENKGLSFVRNKGIELAKGKYLAFIDGDDTIHEKMLSSLLEKAEKGDFSMVTCGVRMVYTDHEVLVNPGFTKDLLSKEEIKKQMYDFYPAACNKLFKKSCLEDIRFKEGVWFEDVEFIYRLLPSLTKVGVVDGYYYNYFQRKGSITYSYNHKLYDLVANMDSIVTFYQEQNLLEFYYEEIEYTYVRYLYATFIRRLAKMKDKKEFKKGVSYVIKKVKENFPQYKKNPYLSLSKKGNYLKHFNSFIASLVYLIDKNKEN